MSQLQATVAALRSPSDANFQDILRSFAEPLKSNFENCHLWLRFGLTWSLSKESPHSALQAFKECMRIDARDPLPAMLAAKLLLEHLDNPEQGVELASEAIRRCQTLLDSAREDQQEGAPEQASLSASSASSLSSSASASPPPPPAPQSSQLQQQSPQARVQNHSLVQEQSKNANNSNNNHKPNSSSIPSPPSCYYKNVKPLLSKCHLLASIMHAYIYERELESIRQFKISNLKASLHHLELALEVNSNDYLAHFHKALHEARQRSYSAAIDNLRNAITLNPHHIPSLQLLILSLSAMKMYDEALVICESTLHEYEDNLLLLFIKCNLEQCLVESRGYKSALSTAQHMLRCIRRSAAPKKANNIMTTASATTGVATGTTTTTITHNNSNNILSNTTNHSASKSLNSPTTSPSTLTASLPVPNATLGLPPMVVVAAPVTANTQLVEAKQFTNLFADDFNGETKGRRDLQFGELSVWLLVAEIFVKIGSIEDAELCVDEGSVHANGALSHQIMYIRGLIAKARNNLIEAKTFFQSCLALHPRHAKSLQQIAHVHYLLGNQSTAERFLKDSLDVDSDCHKTWHYLSLVFIEQNQHEKANECTKKATSLEESAPVIPIDAISRITLQ